MELESGISIKVIGAVESWIVFIVNGRCKSQMYISNKWPKVRLNLEIISVPAKLTKLYESCSKKW